ncbi:MAG: hypothetical protein ACO3SZ_06985 [Ilumatobacteraceae bacterium]
MVTSCGSVFDCDGVLGAIRSGESSLILELGWDYTVVQRDGGAVVINIKEFWSYRKTTVVALTFFFINDYSHTETLVLKVSHVTPQM